MAFNGFCTGNDMKYSSEGGKSSIYKLKLKAPKPSYEIISNPQKTSSNYLKVDFKPSKDSFFNKNNIPKWIEVFFYIIQRKNNKRIISLHIINKCLTSKNPYIYEPNLILYCHENETDLLRLLPFLIDISIQMKCDIVSFDYFGFGCSSGKPKIDTILSDSQEALNFAISELNYKIENIILFGMGIGAMSSIYLASRQKYHNLKALLLCMPIISNKIVDLKVMRSISCQTLLIKEFEDKNEISNNEVINLCREIPNEKEWLPIRKKNIEFKNTFFGNNIEIDDEDDVYNRHRSKFILKIKNYICPDNDIISRTRGKTSTNGGSTESETYSNSSEICHQMSIGKLYRNNNIPNINFDDENEIDNKKNNINKDKIIVDNNSKYEQLDDNEIEINNDEDY